MKKTTILILSIIFWVCFKLQAQVQLDATGSANAFVVTYPAVIVSAPSGGIEFTFKANHSITGTCSLNLNSTGAKPIVKNFNKPLQPNDIVTGQFVKVIYDNSAGGVWQMMSTSASVPPPGNVSGSGATNSVAFWNNTNNIASNPALRWNSGTSTLGIGNMDFKSPGTNNIFFGNNVGNANTGSNNVFLSNNAGTSNTTGYNNNFIGAFAGTVNTTGNNNIFIGLTTGANNIQGTENIFIGKNAGAGITNTNNNIAIGTNANVATGMVNGIAIGVGASVSGSNMMALGGVGTLAVNVGIGTTSPAYQLHIQKSGTTLALIDNTTNSSRLALMAGGGSPGIEFSNTSTTGLAFISNSYNNVGMGNGTVRMFINGTSGNVGIGTGNSNLAPNEKLVVVGNTSITGNSSITGTMVSTNARITSLANGVLSVNGAGNVVLAPAGSSLSGSGTNGAVNFWTGTNTQSADATNFFWDNTNKRLGIGTNAPNAELQLSNNLSNRKLVIYQVANNDHEVASFGINSGLLRYQIPATTNSHVFFAGVNNISSNELLRIKGDGNIEMPSVSNSFKLGDFAKNKKLVFYDNNVTNDFQFVGMGIASGEFRYMIPTANTTQSHVFMAASSAASAVELMRIRGDGNVGIGTATPNAPLQFSNAFSNKKIALFELLNNDHQFAGFGINSSTLRYQIDATTADHVFFAATSATTSNELMRIKGNGNVGIGTATPASKLDVAGNIRTNGEYTYATNRTKNLAIAPAAFQYSGSASGKIIMQSDGDGLYLDGTAASTIGYLTATISVPDGATITGISMAYYDNDIDTSNEVVINLFRAAFGSSATTMATISSSGDANSAAIRIKSSNIITTPVVDNDIYFYTVKLTLGNALTAYTRFHGLKITYLVNKAD